MTDDTLGDFRRQTTSLIRTSFSLTQLAPKTELLDQFESVVQACGSGHYDVYREFLEHVINLVAEGNTLVRYICASRF
jgi:hypothetical protein